MTVRPFKSLFVVTLVGVACLFSTPFLLPIHRLPLTAFDSEWISALLLSATLLVAGLAGGARVRLQWQLPAFVLLLLLVCAVQAYSGSHLYKYASLNLVVACIAVLSAYALGQWLVANEGIEAAVYAMGLGLLVGGLGSVLIQCLQLLGVKDLPTLLFFEGAAAASNQPFANVGQPNQLATYLALGVVAAAWFSKRGWHRWLVCGIQVALCAGIAVTQSRMGLLMVVLLAAASHALHYFANVRSSVFNTGFSLVVVAGYVVGLALPFLSSLATGAIAVSTFDRLADASYGDRWTMWSDAVRIALTHPWLGAGVGEYAAAQYGVAQAGKHLVGTPYAHNAFLQLASEFGLAAAIAFLALTACWFARDWKRRLNDPTGGAIWLLMALLGLHAMLEWSLWVLFILIIVSLLFAIGEPSNGRHTISLSARSVFVPIGFVGIVYAPIMLLDYSDVVEAGEKLELELAIGMGVHADLQESLRQLSASTYFQPETDRYVLRAAPPVRRPIVEQEIERTYRVLTRLPDSRTVAVYISALALSGRVVESLPHVERMRVFAVTPERYSAAEQIVLNAIKEEGASVEPLRAELARWRQ